jgi:hypothetical protein
MMNPMTTTTSSPDGRAEQLSLLPNDSTPARFRLSRDTRERGLRHVAEIRRLLAERAAATTPTPLRQSEPRRDRAA